MKATCPGPVTLSIHVQTRPGDAYDNDRLALCWDLVPAVNAELRALVAAGADWIQIDEPSAAIVPGQAAEYVKMFNACVEGVAAKIGYHVCFGNLLSRPRGKRSYRWMFPALLETRCDQFVFEYANREMAEIEMWSEVGVDRDIACGVVDVKSFYMEIAGGGGGAGPALPPAHPRRAALAGPRLRLLPRAAVGRLREAQAAGRGGRLRAQGADEARERFE